jgi:endonuclease/exonuclease/phosphatase family metal-dependent hydrolase
MRASRLGCFLLLFVTQGAALEAGPVVLATYNVENYGPTDRRIGNAYRRGYPKPESEKRALRTAIEAIRADVLALQEMGGPAYLDELRHDLKAEGLDYPYCALVEAEDAERHIALLSRLRLKTVVRHACIEFAYFGGKARVKRGLLEAVVSDKDGDFTVYVLHLKSHLTDRGDDPGAQVRRLGEAVAVRALVRKRLSNGSPARFVILGDFNDGRNSRTLRRLERFGTEAVADCLSAADTRGETWTAAFPGDGSYSEFDHILVSPALMAGIAGGTARVYDGPETAVASDHRPVLAKLIIRGPRAGGGQ